MSASYTAAMTAAVRRPARPIPAGKRTTAGWCVGSCQCGQGIALDGTGEHESVICPNPECGTEVRLERVLGTLSENACSGDCTGAVGPFCVCGCGGRNHGRGWQVQILSTWVPVPGATVPRVEYVDTSAAAVVERKRAAAVRDRKATANRDAAAQRRADRDAAEAARRDATRAAMLAEPGVSELMGDRYAGSTSNFILDMRARVRDGEELTGGQLTAIARIVAKDAERDAYRAAEAARTEAAAASGLRVREGVQVIRGTVTRYVEEEHGPRYAPRTRHVITVQTPDGCRFRGTLPEALEPEWDRDRADEYVGWTGRVVGQRITVVADVQPSDRDPLFGFFKRPRVPAGTPRLAATGPAGQGPDGPMPEPPAPARPRAATRTTPPPPPPMTAEQHAAADAAAARLAALHLAVDTIQRGQNEQTRGWTINGRADRGGFPIVWGPNAVAHMGVIGDNTDASPIRYEVTAYAHTGGSRIAATTAETLDMALAIGYALSHLPADSAATLAERCTEAVAPPPAPVPAPAARPGGWGSVLTGRQ